MRRLRFVLNPQLAAQLSDPSFPLAASSALVSLGELLFGPTSPADTFARSNFVASKGIDLLLHLEQAPVSRVLVAQLCVHAWFARIDTTALEELFDPDQMVHAREQLQMLVERLMQPVAAVDETEATASLTGDPITRLQQQLAPVLTVLATSLSWCFRSSSLPHVSALLRFVRSWVVLPQLKSLRDQSSLHAERTRDGDLDMDADTAARFATALTEAVAVLTRVDAATRVLFRHTCQLQLLRANFPARSVPPAGVLTLSNFERSHPLSRLVVMHLLQSNAGSSLSLLSGGPAVSAASAAGTVPLSKDEISAKLHSFESVLASGGGDGSDAVVAAASSKLDSSACSSLTVASLAALRAAPTDTATRAQTVSVPLADWDWKLSADEASCAVFASLQSVQLFFQSVLPPSSVGIHHGVLHSSGGGGGAHQLVAAVSFLEYAPHSAVTGGLAALLWDSLLEPHIRALVHAAYPEAASLSAGSGSTSAASAAPPPPLSASAANLTAASAAAAAKQKRRLR